MDSHSQWTASACKCLEHLLTTLTSIVKWRLRRSLLRRTHRVAAHSINNYMQHTFWGKTEGERGGERKGGKACHAVWLCKCLCSTWNVCELLLHKTVHIFECHRGTVVRGGGVSWERAAFFALCRLHLNILHMRQVASNGGWRCKALSTLQSLHSAPPPPLLISPSSTHPLSPYSLLTLCQFVDKFLLPRRPERHLRNRVWNFGQATC